MGDCLYNLLFGYDINDRYIEKNSQQFGINFTTPCRVGIIVADRKYGINLEQDEHIYEYYFDLSFEETVRRHNTRNREFGEKDMRRWWREKDFSSVLREQAITCEMDTDSIVEKIYSDLNADRKAIAFMSI